MRFDKNSWKRLSSVIVYKNPWWQVREDKIIRPGGEEGTYCVIETPQSAEIVAVTEKQEVYLIGQYRYPIEKFSWTVPGGTVDNETEDFLEAAKRELREET